MDELNLGIVALLQKDSSITNKELGDRLSVSEVTVAARIRWMEENRVLRVMMQRDIRAAGYGFMALIDINVEGRRPEDVAAELATIEECTSVSIAMSDPDIILNVVARDAATMLEVIERRVAPVAGISSYEIMPALEVVKMDNRFGALDAS